MAEWWAPSRSTKSDISTCKKREGFFLPRTNPYPPRSHGQTLWNLVREIKAPPHPPDWPTAGGLSSKVEAIHAAWYCHVMKWPREQSLKPVFVPLPMRESDAHQVTAYRPKLTTIHVTRKCHVIQTAQRPKKDEPRGGRLGSRAFYLKDFVSSSQNGDHPENIFAKYGYRIDLKVGKTQKKKNQKNRILATD